MSDSFVFSGEKRSDSEPYEYRMCGLDGIFLFNGFSIREHDGETYVKINDIDGLHVAIGRHLVTHRKALVPEEVRFLRKTMDLSQAEMAGRLGNTSQSVARWEKGQVNIPGSAEKLLRAQFIALNISSENDYELLRTLLNETLAELDAMDQIANQPVQFSLTDRWVEDEVMAA